MIQEWAANALVILLLSLGGAWVISERNRIRRLSELYLCLIFVLSLGQIEVVSALLARTNQVENTLLPTILISLLHLLLIAGALFALHAWKRTTVPVAQNYGRLAGGMFVLSAAIVWVGASTWPGEELAKVTANSGHHLWSNGCFAVGGLIMLAGMTLMRLHLSGCGERLFGGIAHVGFVVASVFWIAYLAFRVTATQLAAEQLRQTGTAPEAYALLKSWASSFFGIYLVLAYLAISGYGAALLNVGFSPRWLAAVWVWGGFAFVLMNLVRVPGFDMPLEVPILPYLMGMSLVRRGSREEEPAVPSTEACVRTE
ncbi:MAG: hypothetical protein ACR2IE_16975 [Candidatus Sumerlaeaceae bacterium]